MMFRHLLLPVGEHGLKGDTLIEPRASTWDRTYAAGNQPHRPLIEANRGANALRNQVSVRVRSDGSEGDETTLAPGPDAVDAIRPLQCQLGKTAKCADGRMVPRPPREWSAPLLKVPLGGASGIAS